MPTYVSWRIIENDVLVLDFLKCPLGADDLMSFKFLVILVGMEFYKKSVLSYTGKIYIEKMKPPRCKIKW